MRLFILKMGPIFLTITTRTQLILSFIHQALTMTKKILRHIFTAAFLTLFTSVHAQDCTISITRPSADTIICRGDSVYLKSIGSCDVFLNNSFEDGLGAGWSEASANPSFPAFSCMDFNPDIQEVAPGPGPEDRYMWVGATASSYRGIITDSFDITIGNCQVRFWMRYGRAVGAGGGVGSPCEDPDNTAEGVHLAYSIDDGANWIDFPGVDQFPVGPSNADPPFVTTIPGSGGEWRPIPTWGGGHTPLRWDTNSIFWWHEYACVIPAAAVSTATKFQFYQSTTSGEGWDTWGLDEVQLFCSNNQNVVWSHGPTEFDPVDPVSPTDSTLYWVQVYDTVGNFDRDTVIIYVVDRPNTDLGPDTSICWTGFNTAIFDAGPGFDSYLWNTGETTQIITPNTSGTYIVEVWNVTCFDTDTVNLTVIPATGADAGSDESICQGGFWDFNFSTNQPDTISADSVWWFGGIGTFVEPDSLRPIYYADPTELGPITLGLIAYGSGPCGNDTNYMVLTIDTVPTADFMTTPIDTACILSDITFTASADITITTWEWDFGDATTGTGQIVTHQYASPGSYDIRLVAISNMGCSDTVIYTRVITDPLIYLSKVPSPSCENDTVFFTGLGDAVTYADWIWDFGDATPQDTGKNVWHIYPNSGTYTVNLSVCSKDTNYLHEVVETCQADAGSDENICEHYPFDFSTSATLPDTTSGDSLMWIGGLGNFSDSSLLWPIYTPAVGELGDVTLTLIVYGKGPCGNDTSSMVLSIFDGPEADFTFVPVDSLCVGEMIDFFGTSTTNINTWNWDFGDGNTDVGQNVSHAYALDGFFDVMLTVINDSACVDTVIYTLEIHVLPDADFTILPNDTVCLNTEMDFDATSSTIITDWDWDFGDGNTASGQNVVHTYAASGDYDVYLFVLNENSCTDTVMYSVRIDSLPTSDFSMMPNDTSCSLETVYFNGTGSSDIASWDWDFDDGNIASGQNVSNIFAGAGIYDVMLVVTNGNGCTDTTIHQRVVIDVSVDFTIDPTPSCLGNLVEFTGSPDTITFTDWEWDFGDGSTDIGQIVTHLYATFDTFDIRLVVCSDTVIKTHIVQEPAFADAGSDESICEYYSFDFTTSTMLATANAYDSLRWIGGLGTFDDPTLLHPIYTPAPGEEGTVVQLGLIALARIPCGNDTSFMDLTVFDGPEASFTITPPDSICVNEPLSLDANSTTTINLWEWDFDDGNTTTGQNVIYAWSAAGFYDIRLVVTNTDGCTDTIFQTIEVHELPGASFTIMPSDTVCLNTEMTFDGSGSTTTITDWDWDFGDGNTASGQVVNHTYATFGDYDVYLYVLNNNSCMDTLMYSVRIDSLPTSDFTMMPNDTSCSLETVYFNGTGSTDIISWDWDFDDGNIASGQNVSNIFAGAGIYDVMLVTTNGNGCTDTTIHQRVVIDVSVDFTIDPTPSCLGSLVEFTGSPDTITFTDWEWDFGDGSTGIGQIV
ncbi:MAG: hypothetical protein DRJ15_05975, partial [Bacteroidetes bacterium]